MCTVPNLYDPPRDLAMLDHHHHRERFCNMCATQYGFSQFQPTRVKRLATIRITNTSDAVRDNQKGVQASSAMSPYEQAQHSMMSRHCGGFLQVAKLTVYFLKKSINLSFITARFMLPQKSLMRENRNES